MLAEQHDEWAEARRDLAIPNAAGNEALPDAQYAGRSGLINIKRDDALLHLLTGHYRELGEELGMKAYRAERLFDHTNEGSSNDHKVVLVFAGGEPRINDRELESFRWWDGRERPSVYSHVTSIIARYEATRTQSG